MSDTKAIRIPADLAEMIAAIQRRKRATAAEVLEPILRGPVERLFGKLPEVDQQYARDIIGKQPAPAPAAK